MPDIYSENLLIFHIFKDFSAVKKHILHRTSVPGTALLAFILISHLHGRIIKWT